MWFANFCYPVTSCPLFQLCLWGSTESRQNLENSEAPLEPNKIPHCYKKISSGKLLLHYLLAGASFGSHFIKMYMKRQTASCRSHKISCILWVLIPVGSIPLLETYHGEILHRYKIFAILNLYLLCHSQFQMLQEEEGRASSYYGASYLGLFFFWQLDLT